MSLLLRVSHLSLSTVLFASPVVPGLALPPSDDIPEEVLRTEIIVEARSPITGKPLTAAEYAELQEELQAPDGSPQLDPRVRQTIFLLQIRRMLRPFIPFLLP